MNSSTQQYRIDAESLEHESAPKLQAEVSACLPIFSVLANQLAESMKQVEQAVVQIGDSFKGIADRSRESVTQAASCLGTSDTSSNNGKVGGQALVTITRQTMQRLLDRIEQARQLSLTTVQSIEVVEQGMQSARKMLLKVDSIAAGIKLLSLNARIEAARAGKHGVAFGVVATETGKVADDAAAMSLAIRDVIQNVSRDVLQMTTELRSRANSDQEVAHTSKEETDRALDLLTASHEQMRRSVEFSVRNSEEVARDVGRAIMGLQFQDAVSQRVGHVVAALHAVEEGLNECLDGAESQSPVSAFSSAWYERLDSMYTMAQERELNGESQRNEATAASAACSVELF